MNRPIALTLALSFLSSSVASAQCLGEEHQKLVASDAVEGSAYGYDTDISGDVAIVGAYLDGDSESSPGAAYIYRFQGGTWIEEAKLASITGVDLEYFGFRVAIWGDVAAISATRHSDTQSLQGAVYVYRHDGTTWTLEQKIVSPNVEWFGHFGSDVSLDGERLVVGVQHDSTTLDSAGAAYVFRHDGTSWVFEQRLAASDEHSGDLFGGSVSIQGNLALIGAPWDDTSGEQAGSSYIYRYDGTNWVEEQKLWASDGDRIENFGASTTVQGDLAVIGSRRAARGKGAAYIYRFDEGIWAEEQKLELADASLNDYFGSGVDLDGTKLVVSASGRNDRDTDAGAAYVFRFDGLGWPMVKELFASDAEASDNLGIFASISGDRVIVGAYGNDDAGESSGSAYVYNVSELAFDIEPNDVEVLDAITLSTCGGGEGLVGFMFITAVDSVPMTRFVVSDVYDALGGWRVGANVPNDPEVAGHTFTMQAFMLEAGGGILRSNEDELSVQ